MVRCMIKSKQLPWEFCEEVVAYAIYILNKCLTKSIHDKNTWRIMEWKETFNTSSQSLWMFYICPGTRITQEEIGC